VPLTTAPAHTAPGPFCLTLANRRLNPSNRNDPWDLTRAQRRDRAALRLNARLCREEPWSEDRVTAHRRWLTERVAAVSPGPAA
jgi:hypothetical protein